MNSKKGKKSRTSKPVNPNPPQSVNIPNIPPGDDKLDEQSVEKLESELKCDEKGPETVSDVPVLEEQPDTPKKPKRNRGKKKKHDKDDDFPESPGEHIQKPDIPEEIVAENIENVPEVTPATRNKKNKKKDKHIEGHAQEIESKDVSSEKNTAKQPEISPPEIKEHIQEPKEQTLQPKTNTDDQEFKTSKKKNKKKNRHDSEKSQHAEEPAASVAPIQKILDTKVEKVEDIKNVAVEHIVLGKEQFNTKPKEIEDKHKNEPIIIKEQAPLQQETKEDKDEAKSSKKKNKKEKKHPSKISIDMLEDQKPSAILHLQGEGMASSISTMEVAAPPASPEDKDKLTNFPKLETATAQEISPKPKAKFAKPVEKKRKGKDENIFKTDELQDDKAKPTDLETVIQKAENALTTSKHILKEPLFEPEIKQKHILEKDIDTATHAQESTEIQSSTGGEVKFKDQIKPQAMSIPLLKPALKPTKDNTVEQEKKQEIKFMQSPSEVSDSITANIGNVTKTSDETKVKDQINVENPGILDSPLSEDIEISSIKTDELEIGICDAIPDVHYPRATSQELLDDNNNMVIKEIPTDSFKLDLPVFTDVPIIQGSGQTPVDAPEIIKTGITIKEINTSPEVREEKTDLKSKMMEVNQDMEELRLSIEKSLAELTTLEKTDEVPKPSEIEAKVTDIDPAPVKSGEKIKPQPIIEETTTTSDDVYSEPLLTPVPTDVHTEAPTSEAPPVCPSRKDHKGKGKHKKKGKHDALQTAPSSENAATTTSTNTQSSSTTATEQGTQQENKKEEKSSQKSENGQKKGKQQSDDVEQGNESFSNSDFEAIDNFEDALTSSVDDVNKSFEMIVNDDTQADTSVQPTRINPEINVIAPEDTSTKQKDEKINPVSQPKNLLGHTDIPVSSSKTDYKKEKDKTPNTKQAKVRIRDSVAIEKSKQSTECQTENKRKQKMKDSFSQFVNNDEYVYKYSFRKVFLQSSCHVCKKDLGENRVPCNYCSLVFYCSAKHKGDDWPEHQALCFAVSTIVHLKNQKHVYADAVEATGYDYRVIRMQMILSCEKVMKRRLAACEQEMLLYPRLCAAPSCREWRQPKLKDCERCGQISFCSPAHLPASHARWCTSYDLYRKLVTYQQTLGRLEPKLPTRVMTEKYQLPEKMNEVLAAIYEEKIDMNDIQYAALTQIATAPLTAAFSQQHPKQSSFTIHVVNAELQFEADALNKWETFFLHLRPEVKELAVVLIGTDLNPSNLPLELLGKIKLCGTCHKSARRVVFSFQDKTTYCEYRRGEHFVYPDLVCAFNASIYRTSSTTLKDTWPGVINSILALKCPFLVTSYTMTEAQRDLRSIIEISKVPYEVITEPRYNPFASVRPDRNFISDDEIPLLFKNYCFMVVCGV